MRVKVEDKKRVILREEMMALNQKSAFGTSVGSGSGVILKFVDSVEKYRRKMAKYFYYKL